MKTENQMAKYPPDISPSDSDLQALYDDVGNKSSYLKPIKDWFQEYAPKEIGNGIIQVAYHTVKLFIHSIF